MLMTMDRAVTQAEFGAIVGINQQAVSDLMARKVIEPNQVVRVWLLAYCNHLREVASSRGADGALALERAHQTRIARERNELQLAKDRREYAPVELIELVCSHVGHSLADLLAPLPLEIFRICPALTPDDMHRVQLAVSKACDLARNATLADFDAVDSDADQMLENDGNAGVPSQCEAWSVPCRCSQPV